jgi:hypothetical protein
VHDGVKGGYAPFMMGFLQDPRFPVGLKKGTRFPEFLPTARHTTACLGETCLGSFIIIMKEGVRPDVLPIFNNS